MSIKHVNEYFATICQQYADLIENIKDLEEEAANGIVSPERIERLQEQVAPIKQNYERWAYMMFLLHQPNRKSKLQGYTRRNKKLLSTLSSANSLDSVIAENNAALTHVGE